MLVKHFIEEICSRNDVQTKSIDHEAVRLLSERNWTGNIRELHNVVERLIILSDECITANEVRLYCRNR